MKNVPKRNSALRFHERKAIEALIKYDCSAGNIANQLNRPLSTIKNEICRAGGKEKYNAELAQESADKRKLKRCVKLFRRVTDEELEIIKQGIRQRWTTNRIRYSIGWSHARLVDFITREDMNFEEIPSKTITERLDALEAQIEILTDIIKEKNA